REKLFGASQARALQAVRHGMGTAVFLSIGPTAEPSRRRPSMIIDTSCYPTDLVDLAWQHDGEPFSGERLIQMMDGPYTINGKPRRIDKAFIQPPQGNTIYTWTDGELSGRESIDRYMAYTLKMVQKYPDRFIGCFVYNPRCGV